MQCLDSRLRAAHSVGRLRLRFIQLKRLGHGFAVTSGKYDDPNEPGDVPHFQALTTALSATVGIGNIAGVATALHYGGPGALFWMWVTAVFGMALKYAECTLSMKYRQILPDGTASGGPMYYIEHGLGKFQHPFLGNGVTALTPDELPELGPRLFDLVLAERAAFQQQRTQRTAVRVHARPRDHEVAGDVAHAAIPHDGTRQRDEPEHLVCGGGPGDGVATLHEGLDGPFLTDDLSEWFQLARILEAELTGVDHGSEH